MIAADILDSAADIIERNGFHKGGMFAPTGTKWAKDCPVCTWGALAIAACGTPDLATNKELHETLPAASALARFLGLRDAELEEESMWTVPDWNDHPDRTAEQVVAALRGAAAAERERAR